MIIQDKTQIDAQHYFTAEPDPSDLKRAFELFLRSTGLTFHVFFQEAQLNNKVVYDLTNIDFPYLLKFVLYRNWITFFEDSKTKEQFYRITTNVSKQVFLQKISSITGSQFQRNKMYHLQGRNKDVLWIHYGDPYNLDSSLSSDYSILPTQDILGPVLHPAGSPQHTRCYFVENKDIRA